MAWPEEGAKFFGMFAIDRQICVAVDYKTGSGSVDRKFCLGVSPSFSGKSWEDRFAVLAGLVGSPLTTANVLAELGKLDHSSCLEWSKPS